MHSSEYRGSRIQLFFPPFLWAAVCEISFLGINTVYTAFLQFVSDLLRYKKNNIDFHEIQYFGYFIYYADTQLLKMQWSLI